MLISFETKRVNYIDRNLLVFQQSQKKYQKQQLSIYCYKFVYFFLNSSPTALILLAEEEAQTILEVREKEMFFNLKKKWKLHLGNITTPSKKG